LFGFSRFMDLMFLIDMIQNFYVMSFDEVEGMWNTDRATFRRRCSRDDPALALAFASKPDETDKTDDEHFWSTDAGAGRGRGERAMRHHACASRFARGAEETRVEPCAQREACR